MSRRQIASESLSSKSRLNNGHLGCLLREKDPGTGLGRRDDLIHEHTVKQRNQTLRH